MPQSFMDDALAEARGAEAAGEVPVGAVHRARRRRDRARRQPHLARPRPDRALRDAGDPAGGGGLGAERLTDCDLYVTLEPCAMCAAAISFARIRRLYYGAADPKGGAVDNGVRFFASPTCHHRPEVYGGIDESEAAALLRSSSKRGADLRRTSDGLGDAPWRGRSPAGDPRRGRASAGMPCSRVLSQLA